MILLSEMSPKQSPDVLSRVPKCKKMVMVLQRKYMC